MQIEQRLYQAQLEQAKANKAKDQANLENAQRDLARYAAIVNTQLAVSRQQYDTQRATVQQDEAAVQSDQAQIDAAKLNVAYCEITSPIDGVTGLRLVDIGNLVQASAATPSSSSHRSSRSTSLSPSQNGISTASGRRWRSIRYRFWRSMAMTTSPCRAAPSRWSTTRSTRTPAQ